jgi:hypothetical protein
VKPKNKTASRRETQKQNGISSREKPQVQKHELKKCHLVVKPKNKNLSRREKTPSQKSATGE